MSSEITNIGLKGLWGQIQHFFINKNKTDKNCVEVQKNRFRTPRAFYGKYKYFKIYDKDDADYINKLDNKYNFENNGVYLDELFKGGKNVYYFTNIFLFVFVDNTFEINLKVEYASIDKANVDQENIDKCSEVINKLKEKLKMKDQEVDNIMMLKNLFQK